MNGPYGERFPYTNFHDLNLDWVIKIAKDFLDQYTSIQQLIEDGIVSIGEKTDEGLTALQDKADEISGLLDAWYEEHSQDIADQLADALEDLNEWYTEHQDFLDGYVEAEIQSFSDLADAKAADTIASIPDDYTALSAEVTEDTALLKYIANATALNQEDASTNLFWMFPCTQIQHGITMTYDPSDGTITFNGTATAHVMFPIRGTQRGLAVDGYREEGTYTATFEKLSGTVSTETQVSLRYGTDGAQGVGTRWVNNSYSPNTVTVPADTLVHMCVTNGTTCTNAKYKLSITKLASDAYMIPNITAVDAVARNRAINAYTGDIKYIKKLDGYFYSGYAYDNTGKLDSNANFTSTDLFIMNNNIFHSSTQIIGYVLFDSDMTFISRSPISTSNQYYDVVVSDPTAKYIGFMFYQKTDEAVAATEITDILYDTVEVCTVGENQQYTGFADAMKHVRDVASRKEKAIINIYPGEYDVYDEYGGDEYLGGLAADISWNRANPTSTIPLVVNGIGRVVLKMEIPDAAYSAYTDNAKKLSIINCTNSVELNNIVFVCKNNRYAIHDESGGNVRYYNTSHIYRNCVISCTNSMACAGIGASTGSYLFEDCYLNNTGNNSIFLHNWDTTDGGYLTIKNTVTGSALNAIRVSNNSDNVNPFVVDIESTYCNGRIYVDRTADYDTNMFQIMIKNCNRDTVQFNTDITTNVYEPMIFNW